MDRSLVVGLDVAGEGTSLNRTSGDTNKPEQSFALDLLFEWLSRCLEMATCDSGNLYGVQACQPRDFVAACLEPHLLACIGSDQEGVSNLTMP